MNEIGKESKITAVYAAAVFLFFGVWAGISQCSRVRTAERSIADIAESAAAGARAEESARQVYGGTVGLEEQMRSLGESAGRSAEELRDVVTGLGGLREDCDRLAAESIGFDERLASLENSIIEYIGVFGGDAEAEEHLAEHGPCIIDPGGD